MLTPNLNGAVLCTPLPQRCAVISNGQWGCLMLCAVGEDLETACELKEKLGEGLAGCVSSSCVLTLCVCVCICVCVYGVCAGAFGTVYRALHPKLNFEFAVKTIPVGKAEAVKDIKHEISILQQCRNKFVVGYYGCWGPDSQNRLWMCVARPCLFSL